MRASSLPPRLEAVRARLCGDVNGMSSVNRASTPVPHSQIARGIPSKLLMNRPLKAEQPQGLPTSGIRGDASSMVHAAENIARDVAVASTGHVPGDAGWGVPSHFGSAYGVSHITRHTSPPQRRQEVPSNTEHRPERRVGVSEVPDFVALHEREKQRLERLKYRNRQLTVSEPFIFTAQSRSQSRQPAPPKDPSTDWRWNRPGSARPASRGAPGSAGRRPASAGRFSQPTLERPPQAVPPKTTLKTTQSQQHTRRRLEQRRELERQMHHESERSKVVSAEMQGRVSNAVGFQEPLEDRIEQLVRQKVRATQEKMHTKKKELQQMSEKVGRRPLLMEQTDSLVRARRRALFRVKSALEEAGVRDVEDHFEDDEIDELERRGRGGSGSGSD